jgi:hypothetical protein
VLTKTEENRLLFFERKALRMIYGQKIEDGVFKIGYNFELDRELNSPNVTVVVKSNILRYAEHMIKGAEDLPQIALYSAVP